MHFPVLEMYEFVPVLNTLWTHYLITYSQQNLNLKSDAIYFKQYSLLLNLSDETNNITV